MTEEHKRKIGEANKGHKVSEETRNKISLAKTGCVGHWAGKKRWLNKKHPSLGLKRTEEAKQKMSLASKGKKKKKRSEQYCKNISLARKGIKFSEEHCKNIGLAQKGKKLSETHLRNILSAVCARPNKFEVRALAHLNIIYNNKFKYTGDGSFIVNHRSADAYSEELNTIALFNGIYWHLGKYGFKNTEKAKGAIELIESIPFLEAGYKVIFIWEDEI